MAKKKKAEEIITPVVQSDTVIEVDTPVEEETPPKPLSTSTMSVEEYYANGCSDCKMSKLKQRLVAYVWKLNCNGYTPVNIANRAVFFFKLKKSPLELAGNGTFKNLIDNIFKLEL